MKVIHNLKPVYNEYSKVLILGSMPSVKSREQGFYYSHPQNRFWKTLEKVFEEKIGDTTEERKNFVLNHNIALFDVIKSCEINSSSDNSIKKVIPNNISKILKATKIEVIITTGRKSYDLYNKYIFPKTKMKAIYLPSTSPANCQKGIEEKLYEAYKEIKKYAK